MRGRAPGRLCAATRGVVSDVASRLINGVIRDLPFNVIGPLMETDGIITHSRMICQPPQRRLWCVLRVYFRKSPVEVKMQ